MGLGFIKFVKNVIFSVEPLFSYCAVLFFIYLLYYTVVKRDKPCCIVLALLCALIFDEYMDIGFGLPGVEFATIKYSELVLLFGIIVLKKPIQSQNTTKNNIAGLFIVFSAFFALSAIRSSTSSAGFNEGLYAFRYEIIDKFLFFVFVSSGFHNKKDYTRFVMLFAVFIVLVSVPNFQMYLHGWDCSLFPSSERQIDYIVSKHSQHAGRFGGYFVVSNRSGIFCATVFPLLFSCFLGFTDKYKKYLFGISALMAGAALFTTNSRSAMVGVLISIISLAFLHKAPASQKIRYGVLVALVLTILAPTLYSRVRERFLTINAPTKDVSARQRLVLYDMTAKIIQDNLILGIGYGEGNFKKKINEYGGVDGVHDNPHNSYLQLAVMLGCPALMLFLLIMTLYFKSALRVNRNVHFSSDKELHAIHTGIISGMISLVIGVFFNPILFVHSISSTMWVFISLGLSMKILSMNKSQQQGVLT